MRPLDLSGAVRRAQHLQRPGLSGKAHWDSGTEWTSALLAAQSRHKALFGAALWGMGMPYGRIRLPAPRHKGKAERQHRTDELRFRKHMRMYSLADGRRQLQRYGRQSNTYILAWLNMRWPNQALAAYLGVMRQGRLFGQVCQTAFRHCTSRFLRRNL